MRYMEIAIVEIHPVIEEAKLGDEMFEWLMPSIDTRPSFPQGAGGRVQRTSGVQFPFLADFVKKNLEQRTQDQVQADSANSSETRLDSQKSITSAEQQQVRGGESCSVKR